MPSDLSSREVETLKRAFDRVSAHGWGLALGLLAGLGLFLATVVLVARGGPNPGPHLALLGQYLPGYRVTWPGAVLGLAYGIAAGYAAGFSVGVVYNWIVARRVQS
jgi:hypothetical protein